MGKYGTKASVKKAMKEINARREVTGTQESVKMNDTHVQVRWKISLFEQWPYC